MSEEDKKSWIYAGGLPYELTEGDIVCVFSQYGEILEISLSRDKETGKSRGFCFIKYEDHRSCELAVDNLNTATVVGRKIKVSHANNVNAVKARRSAAVPTHEQTNNSNLSPQIENDRERLKRKQDRSPSPLDDRDRHTRQSSDRYNRESRRRSDDFGDKDYKSEHQVRTSGDKDRSLQSSRHREHHRGRRRNSQERDGSSKKSSSHHDSERRDRDRVREREHKHCDKEYKHRSRSRERMHRDRSGSRERRYHDIHDRSCERVHHKHREPRDDNRHRNSERRHHRHSER